jgi:hypothetical protein
MGIHSDKQLLALKKYCPTANLSTKTKYFSQRDNFAQPHRTCNSSTNAMFADWLLRSCGHSGLAGDDGYLQNVLDVGDTTIHEVQTEVLKRYGFTTYWNTDGDFNIVKELLQSGFPIPVNILHRGSSSNPRGGHVILLIGIKGDTITSHDPYGTLKSDYEETNGRFSKFSVDEFLVRWQGGYRTMVAA